MSVFSPAYFRNTAAEARLCPSETGCSGHELHGGAVAQFHFAFQTGFDPWLGLSVGYGTRRLFEKSAQWAYVPTCCATS